jgi:hypothetical protein
MTVYKTAILPVVLHGCEAWCLTLRKKQKLTVFEDRVLKKIFGPMKDQVTGEWRRLHNEELYALYSSLNIIWVIKSKRASWVGHMTCLGIRGTAYKVLVGRPNGK